MIALAQLKFQQKFYFNIILFDSQSKLGGALFISSYELTYLIDNLFEQLGNMEYNCTLIINNELTKKKSSYFLIITIEQNIGAIEQQRLPIRVKFSGGRRAHWY
jgi:hypothetical protein